MYSKRRTCTIFEDYMARTLLFFTNSSNSHIVTRACLKMCVLGPVKSLTIECGTVNVVADDFNVSTSQINLTVTTYMVRILIKR